LGKSTMSEAALLTLLGLVDMSFLPSLTVALSAVPTPTWSGGGPGGCTAFLAAVLRVPAVGTGGADKARALARVWRTCPLSNRGLIRMEDDDDDDDKLVVGIDPVSVRSFLVTSWEAVSRAFVRGKNRGGVRFQSASAARAACGRPGVRGVGPGGGSNRPPTRRPLLA